MSVLRLLLRDDEVGVALDELFKLGLGALRRNDRRRRG